MPRTRHGFSLIELVIALLVGTILTSVALSSYGNAKGRFAARGARSTFASVHARARAQAIELGADVRMIVDVNGDSVSLWSNGRILESVHFGEELDVDIRSATGSIRLCMNPRGYADTDCNSFSTTTKVTFWHNADSTSLNILPLGQLVY